MKLATEFLRPGGWFVTKVFRSKDYNAFIWVLKQLFKKVYATKPSASRKESAEIFIVCQGYKAPTKIDPRFMDPKYIFEELEIEPQSKIDLLKEPKTLRKAKAIGYESIDLRRIVSATEFLKADNALDVLQVATEINIDDIKIEEHIETTAEIKECFKDIKVLGRKDLKDIIKWWKRLKEELYPVPAEKIESSTSEVKEYTEEDQENIELGEMEKFIEELKMDEQRNEKRKKKRINKERSKLDQKLSLKMVIKGDSGPQETQDENIFNLREIRNKKVLEHFADGADITKKRDHKKKLQMKMVMYGEDELHDGEAHIPTIESDIDNDDSDEFEENLGLDKTSDDDDDNWNLQTMKKNGVTGSARAGSALGRNSNPLITDLDYRDKDSKRMQKAQLWFEKEGFKTMTKTEDGDQDIDLDNMVKSYKKKGIEIIGEPDKPDMSNLGKKARRRAKHQDIAEKHSDSSSDDSDEEKNTPLQDEDDGKNSKHKRIKLKEEELALGQIMVTSRKMKRDLIDGAWNRYMFNDDNLPDWFVDDEKKSMQKEIPVSDELVSNYRKNLTEFNTRSIKKVMEAKARKKRQNKKKMEKITKKAANIMENADHSGQEKVRMLKKLYKKAETKKQEITYVVAKKTGIAGKKVSRPAGVKGRFKIVDPRLKKDMRGEHKAQKKGRGKTSKGVKSSGKSKKGGKLGKQMKSGGGKMMNRGTQKRK